MATIESKSLWEDAVSLVFERAGFSVDRTETRPPRKLDFVASRNEFGVPRHYGVSLKEIVRMSDISDLPRTLNFYRRDQRNEDWKRLSEYWIVTTEASLDADVRSALKSIEPGVRVMTFNELKRVLRAASNQNATAKFRTRIGKAVLSNKAELAVTVGSLELLLDEKIAQLRQERPNSEEMQQERDQSIAEYTRIKEKTRALAETVAKAETIKEEAVVKSVKTFADGVRSWWEKRHKHILESGYNLGLFTSAVSICALCGAESKAVAVIAGIIAGGKPVVDALRPWGRKLFRL